MMKVNSPPAYTLIQPNVHQTTLANAQRIQQLESLLRARKAELARLTCDPLQPAPTASTVSTPGTPATIPTTPVGTTPVATPFATPIGSPIPTTPPVSSHAGISKPRPMAARGSHWSYVEKARFEAALLRYGPFAWPHIIQAVGTRTEKQVKAYAARYRRRKKLAAKAAQEQLEEQNRQQVQHQQQQVVTAKIEEESADGTASDAHSGTTVMDGDCGDPNPINSLQGDDSLLWMQGLAMGAEEEVEPGISEKCAEALNRLVEGTWGDELMGGGSFQLGFL